MEYTVAQSDSIERIAAMHDCTVGELMKMNRLATRMVFPGQKLLVPYPIDDNVAFDVVSENPRSTNQSTIAAESKHSNEEDRILRGPGMAVQVCSQSASTARPEPSKTVLEKPNVSSIYSNQINLEEADSDSMKRFIKLKVKQMTEMYGTVTGTLLVTPNALMFDPDVLHPLVFANGQDVYIMMARMGEVMSVAMFKSAAVLSHAKDDKEVADFAHHNSSVLKCPNIPANKETMNKTSRNLADDIWKNTGIRLPRVFLDDMDLELRRKSVREVHIEHARPDFKSPLFIEKGNKLDETLRIAQRSYTDLSKGQRDDEMNRTFICGNDANKKQHSSQFSTNVNNKRTGFTAKSFSKLGRTLSAHASTIRGSVTSGAERVTQSAVNSTKSVAQGVISQSKAVAGTLQTGIQTSVKVAAKTAVDAVTAVPQGIASMGSGLFSHHETVFLQDKALKPSLTRKEENLATLLSLKEKTRQLREEAIKNKHSFGTSSTDETLNLFKSVHESPSLAQKFSAAEKSTPVCSLYFMIVRLNKKKREKGRFAVDNAVRSSLVKSEDANISKEEFWFAIPKHKVDAIYHFLLQWDAEKYGFSAQEMHSKESIDRQEVDELLEDHGFIVLNSEDCEKFAGWFLFYFRSSAFFKYSF